MKDFRLLPLLASLALAVQASTSALAGSYTVTVTGTVDGITEKTIGAVEGCARFDVADLVEAGFTNYRIYAGMSRVEPADDDGVYGSPSVAEVKANPDVIPWTAWDQQFDRPDSYFWSGGCPGGGAQVSLRSMLAALRDNGILPIVTLRNVDNNDLPAWAQALNPPLDAAGRNEWWQFVFAWVYWANVRNGLEVHDWQVHNEPDNASQGWAGTLADYIDFTRETSDAIRYVYATYLPGKTPRIYAPVSTHANEWITESIRLNDAIIDVVDWHRYGPPADEAMQLHAWIDEFDTDGDHEDLYLSEWGSYRGEYTSVGSCMNYSSYLVDHSATASYVASSGIFPFYDWTTRMIGLVAPDGTRRECFWAFRLMTRGLNGGRPKYLTTHNVPANISLKPIAALAPDGTLYVELVNKSTQPHTVTLDLSAHATTGTVTLRQYSAAVKDAVTGTASLVNGRVTLSVPKSAIVQVIR